MSDQVTKRCGDYTVSACVDQLSGGWYAYVDVYDDTDGYEGYSVTGKYRDSLFHKKRPEGWGYHTKAEALKERTHLKLQGIEFANNQKGELT